MIDIYKLPTWLSGDEESVNDLTLRDIVPAESADDEADVAGVGLRAVAGESGASHLFVKYLSFDCYVKLL